LKVSFLIYFPYFFLAILMRSSLCLYLFKNPLDINERDG
jgi:hypothetical protein